MRNIKNARYGLPTAEMDEWKAQGSCRDYGWPDLWFSTQHNEEETAVSVCLRCPMLVRCRQTALSNRETFGVWGGMRQSELRRLVGKVAS